MSGGAGPSILHAPALVQRHCEWTFIDLEGASWTVHSGAASSDGRQKVLLLDNTVN